MKCELNPPFNVTRYLGILVDGIGHSKYISKVHSGDHFSQGQCNGRYGTILGRYDFSFQAYLLILFEPEWN